VCGGLYTYVKECQQTSHSNSCEQDDLQSAQDKLRAAKRDHGDQQDALTRQLQDLKAKLAAAVAEAAAARAERDVLQRTHESAARGNLRMLEVSGSWGTRNEFLSLLQLIEDRCYNGCWPAALCTRE